MDKMFEGCTSLKSVNLSNINTSKVESMIGMFYECSSLESIDLSNLDTSNVTYMQDMFYNCTSLKSIDLINLNTSKVHNMSNMFYGCNSLQFVNFSNIKTSSLKYLNSIFYGCSSLESIDLSNIDTSSVINLSYMFYGCKSLKSIDLSNFDVSSVTNMNYMFHGCDSLTFLDVSNFNMDNCDSYSNMFSNISNIKYLNLYNLTNDKIFADTFNETDNLYACQKENILPNAYNCCDYNYEAGECNSSTSEITSNIVSTLFSTLNSIEEQDIPNIFYFKETFIVLLGFSHFEIFISYFSFNIYFVPTKNTIYSNRLAFPIEIIYNNLLRTLQNQNNEANCTKVNDENEELKIRYSSEHQTKTDNIKQIKINPNFTFGSQNNISLIGISPFATIFMDNLQDVQNKFNNLSNPDSKIYVLNNSLVNKYWKNNFNISGTINDPKPNYNNKAINLINNVKKDEEETITELDCTISAINGNNYTINCPSTENIDYKFQSASSYIDSDILIVNFDNLNSSSVPKEEESSQYRKYNFRSSKGLNGGAIAAIIIVPIVALIALVGSFFFIKKGKWILLIVIIQPFILYKI